MKDLASNIERNMSQQEEVLKKLVTLTETCKKRNLLEGVPADEVAHLEKYCADMSLACNVAKRLAKNLENSLTKKTEKPADDGFDFDE